MGTLELPHMRVHNTRLHHIISLPIIECTYSSQSNAFQQAI